jgi:hypothetical protein
VASASVIGFGGGRKTARTAPGLLMADSSHERQTGLRGKVAFVLFFIIIIDVACEVAYRS